MKAKPHWKKAREGEGGAIEVPLEADGNVTYGREADAASLWNHIIYNPQTKKTETKPCNTKK